MNIGIDDNPAIDFIEQFLLEYPEVNIITDEMGSSQIFDILTVSPKEIGFIVRDYTKIQQLVQNPNKFSDYSLRKSELCVLAGQDSIFLQKANVIP